MSGDVRRRDYNQPPPALDEGYWESLLAEGEYTHTVHPEPLDTIETDDTIQCHHPAQAGHEITEATDWAEIEEIAHMDKVIKLSVIGYNRGGLLVEWKSLRGFVPASQLVNFPSYLPSHERRNSLVNYVGQLLCLRVIEFNHEKNRLILSQRAAQVAPGERAQLLSSLSPGDIVEGYVTNLCDFGAFVDLGGLEGLIHISELSWGRVGHPNSILERGQAVRAYVIDVDGDAGRIALSLKRLHPDPWKTVEQRYRIGQFVEGVITNVVDFGAFACIEEGLEGLIHVSELAEGHFLHPRNVVSEGQHIRGKIIGIDGPARRLGLSLRTST